MPEVNPQRLVGIGGRRVYRRMNLDVRSWGLWLVGKILQPRVEKEALSPIYIQIIVEGTMEFAA